MYHVLMLHLISYLEVWPWADVMYLGSVSIVLPEDDDCPIEHMNELFNRFQESQPEADHLFIDWLVSQDEATEVPYDEDSPNLPLQVYLRGPVVE